MQRADDAIVCTLCAHRCRIRPGDTGLCQVRANQDGRAALPYFGRVAATNVDPIEKKPLYHFHPGARLLSLGFLGCNFRCPFCQNYSISQSTRAATQTLAPDSVPDLCAQSSALGVAYTYNEPTIHFEYVMESARLVAAAGYANVVVTNGHLTRKPARELLKRVDAANVDLKSFNRSFYEQELNGKLDAVQDFIRIAAEETCVEVTTLLIPGKNDSEDEVEAIASFIASLDPAIPLHLSAYYPTYHYDIDATSVGTIDRACEIARRHLRHVYPGNVSGESVTRCASCGNVLIRRRGYHVDSSGVRDRFCAACGATSPITWFSPRSADGAAPPGPPAPSGPPDPAPG